MASNGNMDVKRAAYSLGAVFAVLQLACGVLVALAGNWLASAWMGAHFMSMQYSLQPFDAVVWLAGTVAAGIIGAIIGALFAVIWNAVGKSG